MEPALAAFSFALLAQEGLEAAPLPAMFHLVLGVWLFFLGGCIGSFMNVVVYRLPAGVSLVYPPSRCPACGHDIRWRDNIPIVGWLLLRGRCRDCGVAISPRYPLVESIVATGFVMLAIVELFFNPGLNPVDGSPSRLSLAAAGGAYAYHVGLLCCLLCGALIDYDGHPWPARLIWPVLLAGLLLPAVWPYLRPVQLPAVPAWLSGKPSLLAIAEGLAGAGVGLGLGLIAGFGLRPPWRGMTSSRNVVAAVAWTGAFLGPAAAAQLAAIASIAHLLQATLARVVLRRRGLTWLACLTLAALGWLLLGAPLPAPDGYWRAIGIRTLIVGVCSVAGWLAGRMLEPGGRPA